MKTNMDYSKAAEWILGEKAFDSSLLGKCEAVMSLGNGYLGVRSTTEEKYLLERRDLFVSGTFNKFDEDEVTELPNAADVIAMDITLNGESFSLDKGTIKNYHRGLNIRTGELERNVEWISPKGEEFKFCFKRIASMDQLHTIAQLVEITAVNSDADLVLVTGIDGRMSNSGSQHFSEGSKRLYDKIFMQYIQTTGQSKIDFVLNTGVKFSKNEDEVASRIIMDRRKIYSEYKCNIEKGQTLTIEKISNVYTSRDKENSGLELQDIQEKSLNAIKEAYQTGYHALSKASADVWEKKVWSRIPITIESKNQRDQLAIRFIQYHLYAMTPAHDNRMNIAAKGLSGEGYKGHTFWDTDIFALPFFTFSDPEIARSLEEYRYLSLPGAHKKAKDNGFEGAQYPWESAWLDDGEVTPVWGAADIITGLPTKIWSGFIEQHITSDVAYGIWQYYMVTGDQEFMDQYGYELLMDTAKFWSSRLEWDESDKMYHINDVVGPDEYKEHADDNAFTNYMAHWNVKKAIEYYHILKNDKPEIYQRLNEKLGLDDVYKIWCDRLDEIYLPQPREEDLVIPQDRYYLTYEDIDLTKYKNQEHVGSMFLDYSLEQVTKMQVSKQADIMMLFFLMEDMFSLDVKKANWDYYEPRTLHDSSLSLSTHVILASDMGNREMAYDLFQRAIGIDMGENMKTSDDGIHSASLAGVWQSVVFGFAGVRMLNGTLRINPTLPADWSGLSFYIFWHGQKLHINISETEMTVINETKTEQIEFEFGSKTYQVVDELTLHLSKAN